MFCSLSSPGSRFLSAILICCAFSCIHQAFAQDPPPPAPPPPAATPASQDSTAKPAQEAPAHEVQEVSSQDTPATFKVRVNNVLVRVVVRDSRGKVVGNLKKEDFQLFDGRKLQAITSFAVENPRTHTVPKTSSSEPSGNSPDSDPTAVKAAALPQRFVSMVFDDTHMSMQDAVFVRDSATRFFSALAPSDRVSINTTSGQLTQDFTDDHSMLEKALLGIVPRPLSRHDVSDCPDMSYYQADLIINKNDTQALAVATEETLQCAFNGDTRMLAAAQGQAQMAAQRAVSEGDN